MDDRSAGTENGAASTGTTWVDRDARIVIVDDDATNVALLRKILAGAGYGGAVATTESSAVVALCSEQPTDLLLLDLHMPTPDGFEVLSELQARGSSFPIVVLTADHEPQVKLRALAAGARDFLTKPFDRTEVLLRIENHLQIQLMQRRLRHYNEELEAEVSRRTADAEEARRETLDRLALVAEYRDDDTGEHVRRVGRTSGLIARTLGLPREQVELLAHAATLHDVGKIAVPDRILLKQGGLTDSEYTEMKTHVALGERILAGSRSQLLQTAERIARSHHERWDGSGYPRGLRGEEIPLAGRIASVADVFDALTHQRPYKPAWSVADAVAEIRSQSGRQFDPKVVAAFERLDHEALLDPVGDPYGDGDGPERRV
jgi:putative two-component system response regulator